MKNKALHILAITYFVIINTRYYLEEVLGVWMMLIVVILFLLFATLGIALFYHIIKSISEEFKSKSRNILLLILTLVIGLTIYKPFGLVNFDKIEGKNLFIAYAEGSANCMTTLKLKEKGKFIEKIGCFGVSITKGTYALKNDTIWFSNILKGKGYYKFGVIMSLKNNEEKVLLYHNENDTIPLNLLVSKNEL